MNIFLFEQAIVTFGFDLIVWPEKNAWVQCTNLTANTIEPYPSLLECGVHPLARYRFRSFQYSRPVQWSLYILPKFSVNTDVQCCDANLPTAHRTRAEPAIQFLFFHSTCSFFTTEWQLSMFFFELLVYYMQKTFTTLTSYRTFYFLFIRIWRKAKCYLDRKHSIRKSRNSVRSMIVQIDCNISCHGLEIYPYSVGIGRVPKYRTSLRRPLSCCSYSHTLCDEKLTNIRQRYSVVISISTQKPTRTNALSHIAESHKVQLITCFAESRVFSHESLVRQNLK